MSPEFATALPFVLIGLALLLLVIWWIARNNRKTTVIDDETSGPAIEGGESDGGKPTRNQALIDAPKASEISYGTRSANANADEIAMAGEDADAEAGVSVAPTVGDPVPPRPGQETAPGKRASASRDPDEGHARSEPRKGETKIDERAPHPEAREGERIRPSPPSTPVSDTPVTPSPTPKTDPSPLHAAGKESATGDDLTRIKGLGPKLAGLLRDKGVTSFTQIANWSDADIDRIDADLGRFSGRIRRDRWVEQAQLLEAGDQDAFDQKFGRT